MKLKSFLILILLYTQNLFTMQGIIDKDTQKEITMQQSNDLINLNNLDSFFKQPEYSRSSLSNFFNMFNKTSYGQNFLPLNFQHPITLLNYSSKSLQPREYIYRIIELFNQKLKSSIFVNAFAFIELLEKLPDILKNYTEKNEDQKNRAASIKKCLYSYLLESFNKLKENPNKALDELSQEILNTIEKPDSDISLYKLQNSVVRFLETAIGKLIWNPEDQLEVWLSFKFISKQLEILLHNNIIPDTETLDSLYWTLIYRFSYFLELSGAELNDETYKAINDDLNQANLQLLLLPEKEELITTKAQHLMQIVISSAIKAKAYQKGVIADYL